MNLNQIKRFAGKGGIVLCGAFLLAQTGCELPGMHGGPPGLPRPPGFSGSAGRKDAPQFVQNETK